MTVDGKEYIDLLEADRDHPGAANSYVELLNKTKGHAHRRKLDVTAPNTMQQGGNSVDDGAIHDYWSDYYVGECGECETDDIDAFGYYGYKGKGKAKSKGNGAIC